jgi:hypothetical protein
MAHEALRSLIGNKAREQTVFTPPCIMAVVNGLWVRVEYDPCHGHPGAVLNRHGRKARDRKELPEDPVSQVLGGYAVATESCVNARRRTDSLGLILPWPHKTFCNPPYKFLAAWLGMSLLQDTEHILLIPARPMRKWWRAWRREAEVVALDPVAFVGHDQCFPAPLVLAHRNSPEPGRLTAACVAAGLGEAW